MAGGARVAVVVGDITRVPADVLLVPLNTEMVLGGVPGTIAGAVRKATRGRMVKALARAARPPVRLGDIVETPACGLPNARVYHLAAHDMSGTGPAWAEGDERDAALLRGVTTGTRAAMRRAAAAGYASIALPLVGTGTIGLGVPQVAELMVHAVLSELADARSLREVTFVVSREEYARELARLLRQQESDDAAAAAFAAESRSAHRRPPRHMGDSAAWTALVTAADLHRPEDASLAALAAENAWLKARIADLERQLADEGGETHGDVDAGPMPLAFAAAMVEAEQDPVVRVEAVRKALAITCKFFGAVALADYEAAGAPAQRINGALREHLGTPAGDGRWLGIIRDCVGGTPRRRSFFSDGARCWTPGTRKIPIVSTLESLTALRNRIHQGGAPSRAQAERWLQAALPVWNDVRDHALPFLGNRMLNVDSLIDFGEGEDFVYLVRWLEGAQMLPRAERVTWSERLRKDHVYLTDATSSRFLSLHPFVEYTFCDVTTANEPWVVELVQDEVTFSTFRFAAKRKLACELPRCLRE